MRRIALALLALACATSSAAQSSWDRYQPARLDTTISNHAFMTSEFGTDERIYFATVSIDFPLLVALTFRHRVRPISEAKKATIRARILSRGMDSSVVALFVDEALFEEGGVPFWLPVQSGPLLDLRNLHQDGDSVQVYAQFAGVYAQSGRTEWVFTVNEFE